MFCQPASVHHTFALPANTGLSQNVVSILFHCLRHWPNIKTARGDCSVLICWADHQSQKIKGV